MRTFIAMSALLMATTVVQAVNITDGVDYVCIGSAEGSGCYGALLDVASGSEFSLKCKDASSCRNSHIVVHSGCTLNPGGTGIDCTPQFACMDAEIVVYSSDLATHSNRFLNCYNGGEGTSGGLCKNMNMTLVDSSIMLYCGHNDCDFMNVFLFGSSTLEFKSGSEMNPDPNNALTIYLYSSSQLIDNEVSGYNLVNMTYPPTTTTTPTSTTETPTSTTETPTSTTKTPTTTLITSTTKFTSTAQLTTPTAILGSTETTDGNGDGGGNPPIVIYGAVAGAVFVVVLVVVAICCCRRKRGKSKSDGHQQIPATSAPAKADSIEESREVVTYIQSDNEDENPEEKNDMLVTAGGPSVASDVDLEESSVSSILSEGQVPTRA